MTQKSSCGQTQITIKIKTNFKGVGQECPTQQELLVDVLLGFEALGEDL